jgi:hypothetical protein
MRDADGLDRAALHRRFLQLMLRPFAAVEQQHRTVEDHRDRGHVAIARRRAGGRA